MSYSSPVRHRHPGVNRHQRFPGPAPAKENRENSIAWRADETALSNKVLKRPLKVRGHRMPITSTTLLTYIFCVDKGRLINRYI